MFARRVEHLQTTLLTIQGFTVFLQVSGLDVKSWDAPFVIDIFAIFWKSTQGKQDYSTSTK